MYHPNKINSPCYDHSVITIINYTIHYSVNAEPCLNIHHTIDAILDSAVIVFDPNANKTPSFIYKISQSNPRSNFKDQDSEWNTGPKVIFHWMDAIEYDQNPVLA